MIVFHEICRFELFVPYKSPTLCNPAMSLVWGTSRVVEQETLNFTFLHESEFAMLEQKRKGNFSLSSLRLIFITSTTKGITGSLHLPTPSSLPLSLSPLPLLSPFPSRRDFLHTSSRLQPLHPCIIQTKCRWPTQKNLPASLPI